MSRIPAHHLRFLRNQIPITRIIQDALNMHAVHRDGFLRFLCPSCNLLDTAVNPKTNLARCFRCAQNFNAIELVMAVRSCSFLDAVRFLRTFV